MSAPPLERHRYGMAPVIRFTLLALYVALVLPLPLLAPTDLRPWLWVALVVGWLVVMALTSEAVIVDDEGLEVGHPRWCAWWIRRGWTLSWSQVEGLTPVATSQGGRVFYVRTRGEGRSWLLPQRVERFEEFLARVQALGGVDTSAVGRISPPWTYQLLAGMSALMLLAEVAWLVALS